MEKTGSGYRTESDPLKDLKLKGGIGFSYSGDWLSNTILFFRGGKFSHVFVVTSDDVDNKYIEHAIETGVYVTTMEQYLDKDYAFEVFMPLEGNIDEAVEEISKLIGKRYGYLQLFGFVFIWLMHKIGIKKSNPFGKGVICSELGWKYVISLGLGKLLGDDWEKIDQDDIAPDHLYNSMAKSDLFKKVVKKERGTTELVVLN